MNELDKIFQSKLENHTAEYSTESWDKIQSRLIAQQTKPRKLPWLWMSLAAIAVIGAMYFLLSADSDDNTLANHVSLDGTKQEATTEQKANVSEDESDKLTEINSSAQVDSEISVQSIPQSTIETATIQNSNLQSKVNDAEITFENREVNLKESTSTNASSNNQESKTSSSQDFTIDDIKTIQNANRNVNHSNVNTGNKNIQTHLASEYSSNSNNVSGIRDVENQLSIRPLRTIGVSSFTKIYSENSRDEYIELSQAMMDDFRQDCPSFVSDRTGVYLDFYVSHELPFSSLSAKDENFEDYKDLRSSTEGPSYSFSAGARLTLMLPNGLGLKTGLNYSQVNEKFSYVDPESSQIKEVITKTTIDGVETIDTSVIIIPGTRDIVSTNKYRSFDIPLLLSYEWDVRERTYMTVNGGIYLNLLFKESGKILDAGGEIIDLVDTSGDNMAIFKNNIGLSLFGSVGLHYRWNSNIGYQV